MSFKSNLYQKLNIVRLLWRLVNIKNKRLLYLFQELEKYSNENLEKSLKDLLLNSNPLFNGLDENSKNIISENLEKNIKKFEKENL